MAIDICTDFWGSVLACLHVVDLPVAINVDQLHLRQAGELVGRQDMVIIIGQEPDQVTGLVSRPALVLLHQAVGV